MCQHNDARSPMAVAWLNHLHGDQFEARSAGLEPSPINPLTIQVMREVGIDISDQTPRRVFDFVQQGDLFSYAVTLSDNSLNEIRASFPGFNISLHWNIPDPVRGSGNPEQPLEDFRRIRDELKKRIEEWVNQLRSGRIISMRISSENRNVNSTAGNNHR